MDQEHKHAPSRKWVVCVVSLVCFALMALLCGTLVQLLVRQGREVDVSVATSGESYTESVTVTVTNVLGMDLLIDECDRSAAMLQYLAPGSDSWEDVCEIRFQQADCTVLSAKYGGMYIHLPPGGNLQYSFDEELLDTLPTGEYRISVRYITETAFLSYLQGRANRIETSLDAMSDAETSVSAEESAPSEESTSSEPSEESTPTGMEDEVSLQVFYTVFSLTNRADASEDTSVNVDVSLALD